ncbi:HAD hydrolase-like protein [Candidatus Nomurabacteria bacterium]|nr:HAD hydrolase-like protein [Candidatus Kaiserbacteria bacterium]MCB9813921.1 HAD hydrolase-like protein [Candidatus Nomurabacteria bacterium]
MSQLNLIFDFDGVIGDTWDSVVVANVKNNNLSGPEEAISGMNKYFSSRPDHAKDTTLSNEVLKERELSTIEFGKILLNEGFDLFNDFVHEIEKISTPNKAIVSRGSIVYIEPALAKTNISPTHILSYENHHSKEEKIEQVCKDWGVKVSEVYYFTDTLSDIYELQNFIAKDKLIGVTWGFCTKEQLLEELSPDHILDTAKDFDKLFYPKQKP